MDKSNGILLILALILFSLSIGVLIDASSKKDKSVEELKIERICFTAHGYTNDAVQFEFNGFILTENENDIEYCRIFIVCEILNAASKYSFTELIENKLFFNNIINKNITDKLKHEKQITCSFKITNVQYKREKLNKLKTL